MILLGLSFFINRKKSNIIYFRFWI